MFNLILTHTIKLSFRKGGGAMGCLAFYIIIFTLFAFALSPEALAHYALAVMCVSLVLASVTAHPLIFEQDYDDGMLEQYLLKTDTLEWVVLAKILGHWVVQLLPILLTVPLLSVMAGLSQEQGVQAFLQLLILSPSITAIGVLTAALTMGSRRGGLLPALVSLPLLVPLVIFGSSLGGQGAMLLLAAFACVTVPVSSFVSAALIRML